MVDGCGGDANTGADACAGVREQLEAQLLIVVRQPTLVQMVRVGLVSVRTERRRVQQRARRCRLALLLKLRQLPQ